LNFFFIQVVSRQPGIAGGNGRSLEVLSLLYGAIFASCQGKPTAPVSKVAQNLDICAGFSGDVSSYKAKIADTILDIFGNIIIPNEQQLNIKITAFYQ